MTWTILGASMLTTLGSLPVFLLGAQAVFIRGDLDFGQVRLGAAVAGFFASAAFFALVGGRLADRLGRRASTVLAGLLSAGGNAAIAVWAGSWSALMGLMVLLGAANAACQVTANLTLATAVPAHRRGLGFGVKQSAVPLAVLLAGVSVPAAGSLLGWRGTFGAATLAALLAVGFGLRLPATGRSAAATTDGDRAALAPLLVTMVAITLASAAANSLGGFVASWGFELGLSPTRAGLLMAVGSALNIAARLVAGHLADRRHGRNLPVVAAQMVVGGLSLAVLSWPSQAAYVPATVLAFALGWSWPGLLLYAVVRVGRDRPAAASGVVQAGAFAGGAAGPFLFGLLVEGAGYGVAWRAAAAAFLLAAALVAVARRLFIADLMSRPPREQLGFGGGRGTPHRVTPTGHDSSAD
jgi:MFS family permease